MKKGFLLSLLCCLSSVASFATTYYYQSGTYSVAANWNENSGGGGVTPTNFTTVGDVWIVASGKTLAVSAAWTVNGQLQIDGTCTITTNPTIAGGITVNSGGLLNQNATNTATLPNMALVQSGTVTYGAGSHVIPAGITFQNLTIGSVSSTSASGDITVNGTLSVASSEVLVMGSNQLLGTPTVANSGTISTNNLGLTPLPLGTTWTGTGTVSYISNDTAQTIVGGTYTNLSIGAAASTVTYTASGNISVSGTLTIVAAGTTLDMGTNLLSGTMTGVANNGTVKTANTTSTPIPSAKNWTTGASAGVEYNGAGAQTVVAGSYTNLTISGARSGADITFANGGNIKVGSGTNGAFNLTASGVGSYLTTGNTFTYVKTNGGMAIAGAIPYNNLTLSNTSGVNTVDGNLTVNGTLSTAAGGTLDMELNLLGGTLTSVAHSGILKTANAASSPIPPAKNWSTGTAAMVEYYGAGAQTVVAGSYTNLTISGARGGADITFTGTVSVCNATNGAFNLTATAVGSYATTGNTFVYAKTNGGLTIPTVISYNNLTLLNSTNTNTADGNLTVGGILTTTTGGTLDMTTNRILDGGSITAAGGGTLKIGYTGTDDPIPTAKNWSGIVNYSGAGSQTVMAGSYAALTISGDHAGGDITLASGNVSLSGTFSVSGASNINSYITTGNTVTYRTLAGAQSVAGIVYNNLAFLNTSGTNTASDSVTVNGTLSTVGGGTFSLGTNKLVGTPTIVNAGTISSLNTSSAPFPAGLNWGAFGTVSYAATGATTVMAGTYNNLTISGAKGGASITFEPGNIVINGTATGSASGMGSYVNTGNTVIFNKATGGIALFAMPVTYNNVTFANTSGTYSASVTNPTTVNGTLTTTSGGILAMGAGQLLGTPTVVNGGTISTTNTTNAPLPSDINWGTTGTVIFATTTSASQTVPGGIYNNLTLAQTGTTVNATAADNITVNGTLTTTTGSSYFDLATHNLIAGTSFAVVNNGTIKTSSTTPVPSGYNWSGTTGRFEYRGIGAQTVAAGTYKALVLSGDRSGADITFESDTLNVTGSVSPTATNVGNYITTGNTFAYGAAAGGQTISAAFTYNNLMLLNTSGNDTAGASITVNGELTTTAGTGTLLFNNAAHQLLMGGGASVNNNGTIQTICTANPAIPAAKDWSGTSATGKVTYANLGTSQTVATGTYKHLTVGGASGTVTYAAGDSLQVNGTLSTALSTTTLDMGSFALSGTTTPANTGTILTHNTSSDPLPAGKSWGGNVKYNLEAGGQTIAQGTYASLYVGSATGGVTNNAGGALTVNTRLDIAANTILEMGANAMGGTLTTIANAGTIHTQNLGTTPLTTGKNWNGTVAYNAVGGGQTVMAGTYDNLITGADSTSGVNTLSGAIIVDSVLNNPAGFTLVASTTTSTIGGTMIPVNNGTIQTAVSVNALPAGKNWGGSVVFNRAGAQAVATGTYNNLSVGTGTTAATYTATGGDLTVNGTLSTTSNATLALAANQLLGTFTVANNGTISSTSTSTTPFQAGRNWGGTISYAGTGATTIVTGTYSNLSISGAHTINNITLSPGNIVINNSFTCTPTFTSGTWVNTGDTVTFNNPGITIGTVPVTYNNVTFNNSGTYTSGASMTVNGTLTTGHAGTVLNFGSVSHQLLGTPTVVNTGTIQTVCTVNPALAAGTNWDTTGEVIFTRTNGGQSIASGTFHKLTFLNTSGTNSAVGNVTVNDTLTTTVGGTLAMQTNQLAGTPVIVNAGAISTTNSSANPFPSDIDWTNGGTGTVSYGGTSTSTIVRGTYNNLTLTGARAGNSITLDSGDVVINNTLTNGVTFTTGSWINTGNRTIFNKEAGGLSTGATAVIYNNLTFNNTTGNYTAGAAITVNGVLTSTAGGTLVMGTNALILGVSASTSGTGTIKTANTTAAPVTASKTWTQTVEFNSASGQSIVAGNYGNLVLSGAGTKTVTGTVSVPGDLNIGSSNTLADGGNTVTVTGDILGAGTHTGAGKIVMNGASNLSGVTLQNLQLNGTGFGLTGNLTVNGTLTFTSGRLDLGSNNLTLGTSAAIATPSASSMIVTSGTGELRKRYSANGSFSFPVGDNAGPNYSPISLSFIGGTYGGGAYASVKVTDTMHPANTYGGSHINRYWTVSTSGITSPVYTVSATYVPGDVVGSETPISMGQYSSSAWTFHNVANTSTHTLTTNANVTVTAADFSGIYNGPTVSANSDTICPTGSAVLAASATGVAPFTYSWAPASGLSATVGTSVTASPTATTVYTVTVTDNNGLTNESTATVTVVPQPSVNIGLSSTGNICPATVMTLTATPNGGIGTAEYKWSGLGISGSQSSGAIASYTAMPTSSYTVIPAPAPGSYTVVLTYSGSGCQSVAATSSSITPVVHQWEGGASGDVNNWSNASNWICGGVPTVSDHILIPVRSNQPTMVASTTSSIARLYMNSGTTLTMGASATLNVSGNVTNKGTITGPATAKLVLNGSSAQVIGGAGNVYNMELNNSTGATIANVAGDTTTVKGTLTLTSGTLTTNGKLMLYADATTNGRIGEITGGAISGNIVTQMWIQTVGHKAWHFFSHPFDNYIAMSMLTNSINMTGSGGSANGWSDGAANEPSSFWIKQTAGWVPFTNAFASGADNQFKVHQGIRIFVWGNKGEGLWGGTTSTSVRMRLYGHPNTGTQPVVMTKGSYTDYNQVGNPYPSPVNIGEVIKEAMDLGKVVGTSYWVWNPALGTSGNFVTKTIDGTPFYISAGNAFQVRTTTDGNTLVFNESHKGTTPSVNLRTYSEGINLTVYDATYHPWDMLSVKFDQESTDAEEATDAGKPESPADLNFYSVSSDNVKLSSDVRPYAATQVIPLGIKSNVRSQFILKADNVTVPTGARVYLHDKLLRKYQLLTQGAEYPFSINENGMSQGDNRFELTMQELTAYDLHTNVALEASLAPNPAVNEVAVSYTTAGAENTVISIADVSGHVIFTKDAGTARSGKVIVPLSQVASGVYLISITSGDARIEKTLIKE